MRIHVCLKDAASSNRCTRSKRWSTGGGLLCFRVAKTNFACVIYACKHRCRLIIYTLTFSFRTFACGRCCFGKQRLQGSQRYRFARCWRHCNGSTPDSTCLRPLCYGARKPIRPRICCVSEAFTASALRLQRGLLTGAAIFGTDRPATAPRNSQRNGRSPLYGILRARLLYSRKRNQRGPCVSDTG